MPDFFARAIPDESIPDPQAHNDLAYRMSSGTYRRVRLVADKSFFHDAFRTDYPHTPDASWMWAYLVARKTLDPWHRILITATSIIDRLALEFRESAAKRTQIRLVVESVSFPQFVPPEENLGWAPLYCAKILGDAGTMCLIVSSVKPEKWMVRMRDAGIAWKFEGFTEGMSDTRTIEQAWFLPLDSHMCTHLFYEFDPLYKKVVSIVGAPPERRVSEDLPSG